MGMLGEEQVEDGVAHAERLVAQGVDDHSVADGERAGGGRAGRALDLDDAHTAGAVGLHAGVVAEVGDVDAGVVGGLDEHPAGFGADLHAVDGERNRLAFGGGHAPPPAAAGTGSTA